MSKVYGYCRISTKKQDLERQVRDIEEAYPDAVIIREVFTGKKIEGRKEFLKLLKVAENGDTIVFDEVSRMSRNAEEGFSEYEKLFNRGVDLVFLKQPQINTETYKKAMGKSIPLTGTTVDLILKGINAYIMELAKEQIRLAFDKAEYEAEFISKRTKGGIETARLNGKQIGQRPGNKLVIKKAAEAKKGIKKYCQEFGGKFTDAETMLKVHVSKPTYYKYKREIREEMAAEAAAIEAEIEAEF